MLLTVVLTKYRSTVHTDCHLVLQSFLLLYKPEPKKYCNHCGYIMNPPVVLRTDSDRKRKEMRVKAWVKITYFLNTEKKEVSVRILKSSGGCLYFCKKGEEPLKYEDVKKAPKIDPEPILN